MGVYAAAAARAAPPTLLVLGAAWGLCALTRLLADLVLAAPGAERVLVVLATSAAFGLVLGHLSWWVGSVVLSEASDRLRALPDRSWGYRLEPPGRVALRVVRRLERSTPEVRELYATLLSDALRSGSDLDPLELLVVASSLSSSPPPRRRLVPSWRWSR